MSAVVSPLPPPLLLLLHDTASSAAACASSRSSCSLFPSSTSSRHRSTERRSSSAAARSSQRFSSEALASSLASLARAAGRSMTARADLTCLARSSTWALRTAGVISASGEEEEEAEEEEEVEEEFSLADAAAEAAIDRGNCGGAGIGDREIFLVMPPWQSPEYSAAAGKTRNEKIEKGRREQGVMHLLLTKGNVAFAVVVTEDDAMAVKAPTVARAVALD